MSNRWWRGRGRSNGSYYQPYSRQIPDQAQNQAPPPAPAPNPVAPAPQPNQRNRSGREWRRAFAALVLDKVDQDATVDRSILRRELTYILERRKDMRRILTAAEVILVVGDDVLHHFMKLSVDEPMKVAGLLGAIKAPTVESITEAIKAQLEQLIQERLNNNDD